MPDPQSSSFDDLRGRLREKFSIYNVDSLRAISPEDFQHEIVSKLGTIDSEIEAYSPEEISRQRDLSIKFHWGHNHDFGKFKVEGRMADRHLDLMADFINAFPIEMEDFDQKRVLDIGCWTGGTTLLLTALGAQVRAVEEVRKYAAMTRFLIESFGLTQQADVLDTTLYDCNREDLFDAFDIVYFPGVVYHLTDPVLALRILFNTLNIGGKILVETAGPNHPDPICLFTGSHVYGQGSAEELNRGGWNWFSPSPSALERMMLEAGFDQIETFYSERAKRVYGYGVKTKQAGICRAGLSVPDIR